MLCVIVRYHSIYTTFCLLVRENLSRVEAMSHSRLYWDGLLVYGYLREHKECDIPEDIMKTCTEWYHVNVFFECLGADMDRIEDDIIKGSSSGWVSAYGNVIMNSVTKTDIDYEYGVKILELAYGIMIGIEDSDCNHLNSFICEDDETSGYAYYRTGSIFSREISTSTTGQPYGDEYGKGDAIKVIYNPFRSTLRFYLNGKQQGLIENIDSKEGLCYRLCVSICGKGSVQLIL